jgi:membrane protein implicated in regulation of membrane protease activity
MDWLTSLYLGCFIFGLIFTVASFLLGGLDHFSIGGHADGGGINLHADHVGSVHAHPGGHFDTSTHAHGGGHFDGGQVHGGGHADNAHTTAAHSQHPIPSSTKDTLGWFNFSALVVFLTWFGGAGFILESLQVNSWLTAPIAIVSGVLGYLAVMLFLSKVLVSSQTPIMRQEDYDLTGTVGKVSSTIFDDGVGEVIFSKYGTRRTVSARSTDGKAIKRESQVVILSFDKGVALVEELDRLLNEVGADKWSSAAAEIGLNLEEKNETEK